MRVKLKFGSTLEKNGEAIYGTRPRIRFTTKGRVLYAIESKWPHSSIITITWLPRSLNVVNKIELFGIDPELESTQDGSGLTVTLPDHQRENTPLY